MKEFYILTLDPRASEVINWILAHKLDKDPHLNRTRFWVPDGALYTEFQLRFGSCCPPVDPADDLLIGRTRPAPV